MTERTLIILKPDCLEKNLMPEVFGRFQKIGLQMTACKMIRLDGRILREHYAHIADKPYYPPLAEFMSRRSVVVSVWEGENAVAGVRAILGPTDSTKAPAGTIRGDYGLNTRENIVHASDSVENAKVEIHRFFSDCEIF